MQPTPEIQEVAALAQEALALLETRPCCPPSRQALAALLAAAILCRRAGLTLGAVRTCWRLVRLVAQDMHP